MVQRDLVCWGRPSGMCACFAGARGRIILIESIKDQDLCLGGNGVLIRGTRSFGSGFAEKHSERWSKRCLVKNPPKLKCVVVRLSWATQPQPFPRFNRIPKYHHKYLSL